MTIRQAHSPHRRFSVQWRPNLIRTEKRLVLTRIYWNRGFPGDGKGYSCKLSVSVYWKWQDLWVGAFVKQELLGCIVWVCLLPCVPIRFHLKRSYGGSFF